MNPFLLPLSTLLQHWKDLRNDLKTFDEMKQLEKIAEFWGNAPLSTYAYDPEALDTYDTAWEMMHSNDWCANSVAVGMEFTLRLGGWHPDQLTILYVKDTDESIQRLVLEIEGKYWLNYDHGVVSLIPKTNFVIIDRWKFVGKNYKRI